MMTCTSEMSGNASSGICRSDQIPVDNSRNVPVKTRKRFFAQQSIQREITSHSSRSVDAELLAGDGLSIFLRKDSDLPRSATTKLAGTLIHTVAFVRKSHLRTHRSHTHCWHRRHGECHGNFRAGDRSAVCIGELYSKCVSTLVRRTGADLKLYIRLSRVHRTCRTGAGWRRHERTESGLQLTLGINQEVRGGNHLFAFQQPFQDDKVVSDASAKLDLSWFEVSVAAIHENNLAFTGLQDARCRNHELCSRARLERNVDEHARRQFQSGIREDQADAHGASHRVHAWVGEIHAAFKNTAGV